MQHFYATLCKIAVNRLAKFVNRTPIGNPDRTRILMFHDVVPDGSPLPDEYACSLGKLVKILDAYRARGFQFVSLDALLAAPFSKAKRGRCVLTFDDGFESLFTLAAPVLFASGVPFTVYVTADWLDRPGYLTKEMLRQLAAHPLCTVGSHTRTHPMTRFLSTHEVTCELLQSRKVLSALIAKPVDHLAFPYGSAYACSMRDVRLAARCGYRSAALTTPTPYHRQWPYSDFRLPRLNMPQAFDAMS